MKFCFMFDHSNAPDSILPELEKMIEYHYTSYGIRDFYVGSRGCFDGLATTAANRVKAKFPDLKIIRVLAYHPAEREPDLYRVDSSFYPPLEGVPRSHCIVRANRYMIETADTILCYVCHFGNTRALLEYARRKQKEKPLPIDNLAEAVK